MLGIGFSLKGLSTIRRVPSNQALDGTIRPVEVRLRDRYSLDGKRLVLVKGTHGKANAVYRTEADSFQTIVAIGNTGRGPLSFSITGKNRLTMHYGGTRDSRSTVKRNGKDHVVMWELSRIEDSRGNYIDFVYRRDADSNHTPIRKILYTGFKNKEPHTTIQFRYRVQEQGAPHNDPVSLRRPR